MGDESEMVLPEDKSGDEEEVTEVFQEDEEGRFSPMIVRNRTTTVALRFRNVPGVKTNVPGLTPERVVNRINELIAENPERRALTDAVAMDSDDPNSPFYLMVEHDQEVAAYEYRKWQARQIMKSVTAVKVYAREGGKIVRVPRDYARTLIDVIDEEATEKDAAENAVDGGKRKIYPVPVILDKQNNQIPAPNAKVFFTAVPAFVNGTVLGAGPGYMAIEDAVSDPGIREKVLRDLYKKARRLLQEATQFRVLSQISEVLESLPDEEELVARARELGELDLEDDEEIGGEEE